MKKKIFTSRIGLVALIVGVTIFLVIVFLMCFEIEPIKQENGSDKLGKNNCPIVNYSTDYFGYQKIKIEEFKQKLVNIGRIENHDDPSSEEINKDNFYPLEIKSAEIKNCVFLPNRDSLLLEALELRLTLDSKHQKIFEDEKDYTSSNVFDVSIFIDYKGFSCAYIDEFICIIPHWNDLEGNTPIFLYTDKKVNKTRNTAVFYHGLISDKRTDSKEYSCLSSQEIHIKNKNIVNVSSGNKIRHLKHGYTKDNKYVYHKSEIIKCADSLTFSTADGKSKYDGVDKNYFYWEGNIIEDIYESKYRFKTEESPSVLSNNQF